MKTSKMKESKFLTKDDVMPPLLVTMGTVERVNVALPGADEEWKWALHFDELDKPLLLNQTNINLINAATSTDDTDDWVGKKIVLYNDPSIMYKGEVKGGVRVRPNQTVQSPVVPNKPKGSTAESFASDHNIPMENKDNEADYLMTYNALPKPTPEQIVYIRKICLDCFRDNRCEIKNRVIVWNYFGARWPGSQQDVEEAASNGCIPF